MTPGNYAWALLLLMVVPGGARGQAAGPSGSAATAPAPAPTPYGSGEQIQASPSSGAIARNCFLLGADFTSSYTDNVGYSNRSRVGDTGFLVAPLAQFSREQGPFRLAFSYRPSLLVYQHQDGYNEQDHDFRLDGSYRATPRLRFRGRTVDTYRSGLLGPNPADVAGIPGLGGPGHLNDTIVTTFARQFENNSRIDAAYQASERTTLGAFSTYMLRTFGKPASSRASLLDAEGKSAGAQYVRRLRPDLTLGLVYTYEDLHFHGSARLGVQNPAVSLAMRLGPRASFYAYAGPEYTRLRDVALVPFGPAIKLAIPIARTAWNWAAGGGVAARWERTEFVASASHEVTDGGGLLEAVANSAAGASLERQVGRQWRVRWEGGWQRTAALAGVALEGTLGGEYGRIVLLRAISENVTAGGGYLYERQRPTGLISLDGAFDRNYAYLTLSYQFKNHPGRR